ncbi:hypothetical protein BRD17_04205 [Halobacteriales archaeon SW_7_68_16]|nr:MAG: hypothetical protein BRD17_04205 [Halobacteriales archaeon SW_7_68_16]
MDERRLPVAVGLSVVPGLGHAYLQQWLRTVLWCGLFLTAFAAVPVETTGGTGPLPVETIRAAVAIVGLTAIDAGVLAVRVEQADDGTVCPDCGGTTDGLAFCRWCGAERDR